MKNYLKKLPILAAIGSSIVLLSSCSNSETYNGFDSSVSSAEPDKFFEFFNQQSKLAAGFYTIIVATKTPGVTANFIITIAKNDGTAESIQASSWTNSFGESNEPWNTCIGSNSNTCFNLQLNDASGVTITVESNEDSVVYLANQNNSPTLLKKADAGIAGVTETISYSTAQIKEASYAKAYYDAVDENTTRDTLQKFEDLHGFENNDVVRVIFRDTKDLGYGRDMYMRSYPSTSCGGQQVTAFYVRNFQVDIIDDFSYGEVNLEAAIENDTQYHFGTNAIEFSRGLDGETCAKEAYPRFFTYKSDYSSVNAPHNRLEEVDLDGRGDKAMPQPCISCHGGKARPLDRFGRFVTINANDESNQIGDTKSRMQTFEVDTFEFSTDTNQTQADYEDGLRILNSAIYCTYEGSQGHPACADFGNGLPNKTDNGEWNAGFAREMLLGAYDNKLEVSGTAYTEDYVPTGWRPTPGIVPEGADTLFTKVISPNCFVCHGKRGSDLGSDDNINNDGKDIDFSSYTKFISHAEEIKRLVFEEGRMPLGLLNYDNFWEDSEKSELLALFIAPHVGDLSRYLDADNNVLQPALAVTRAGLDRVTKTNAPITLNASASLFVDTYQWQITSQPLNSVAVLSQTSSALTEFETDTIGSYEIQLTANNSDTASSDIDTLTIVVDDTLMKAPRDLSFYNDVSDTLIDCANTCHSTAATGANPAIVGIPVLWSDDTNQPLPIPASITDTPALGLFEQFMTRVNLNNIEDSLVLKKPSNNHHNGGLRANFDASQQVGTSARISYDLFVNWISEGAVCGGTQSECPNEE